MRTLGVDLGSARVGLAVSDELGVAASPVAPLKGKMTREELLGALVHLARRLAVERIVIGLPVRLNGTEGRAAREARAFARLLSERTEIEVELWDERLSTVQAERFMIQAGARRKKRRERIDSVAAALVLQSYLDAQP